MWSDPDVGCNQACLGCMGGKVTNGLEREGPDDLVAACRHLEDLEVFVGQRSRMHPGPGWALLLRILARDLAEVRSELLVQNITWPAAIGC